MSSLKSKLIRVSSKDLLHSSDTSTKFTINLGYEEKDLHKVLKTTLISAIFSNTHYNINANNNTWIYDLNGVETTKIIPIGQYNTTTLMAELILLEPAFTISQSTLTGKISFEVGAGDYTIYSQTTKPLSTISPFLGIITDSPVDTTAPYTADYVPNLNGLDLIFVKSYALAKSNTIDSDGSEYNILTCIPVDVAFGANVVYHNTSVDEGTAIVYGQPRNLHNIDIELTDQNHNPIHIQDDVVLIFKVYF